MPLNTISKMASVWVHEPQNQTHLGPCLSNQGAWMRTVMNVGTYDPISAQLGAKLRWINDGEVTIKSGNVSVEATLHRLNVPLFRVDQEDQDWPWGGNDATHRRMNSEMGVWNFLFNQELSLIHI